MKKYYLFICAITFFSLQISAQGIPVPTTVQKKNVVLETFTGFKCQFCPDGHKIASTIVANNPGKVILVNIHAGQYAVPGPNDPDYRVPGSSNIIGQTGVQGLPAGTVNRLVFTSPQPQTSGNIALNRGSWTNATNQTLVDNAIANLGVEAVIDVQTGLLTVQVQVYYTATSSTPTGNRLSVMILQDNIAGPQVNMSQNSAQILPDGQYNHDRMLRHIVTNPWQGEIINNAYAGQTIDRTFTYVIGEQMNGIPVVLGDLEIVAFVAEGPKQIITGQSVKPSFTNFPHAHNVKAVSVNIGQETNCGFTTAPFVKIQNLGGGTLSSLQFDYSVNNSPVKTYQWTGNLQIMSETEIQLSPINYFPAANNTLEVTARLPNANPDGDESDNEITFSFPSSPEVSNAIIMTLQLDYWGAECTWKLFNAAGTVLYQGGPYTNVSNPGSSTPLPAAITQTFNLPDDGCYRFSIYDSYGDGLVTNGSGLKLEDSDGFVIVNNYKNYNSQGDIHFGYNVEQPDSSDVFGDPTGITQADFPGTVSLFPNPAQDKIFLNVALTSVMNVNVEVTNLLGQIVYTSPQQNTAETGTLTIDASAFRNGVYFINVTAGGKRYVEKVMVNK